VEYNPEDSLQGEYVLIENQGASDQDMTGWTLGDDQTNTYLFPSGFILPGGASVYVWTKDDVDTATDLHWRRDDPVWDDQGGTAYLWDDTETMVDSLDWDD